VIPLHAGEILRASSVIAGSSDGRLAAPRRAIHPGAAARTAGVRPFTAILPARTSGDFAAGLALGPEADVRLVQRQAGWQPELDDLAGVYTPPRGQLLVARVDGRPLGAAGIRVGDDGAAELRRMYVAPAGRGLGLGAALLHAALASARSLGARTIRVETSRRVTGHAVALYEAAGFVPRLADGPGAMTMELVLEP
jgi:GNAT superfamily N-acetyltransferase